MCHVAVSLPTVFYNLTLESFDSGFQTDRISDGKYQRK